MVKLTEAQLIGIVALTILLSGGITEYITDETFYCEPEDNVKQCLRVSSSGLTCYYEGGSDRCVGSTWQPIQNFLEEPEGFQRVTVKANAGEYNCEFQGEEIDSYTVCIKTGGQEAYLGELI